MHRSGILLTVAMIAVSAVCAWAQSPVPGPNVNMVSGTDWTTGDPFLQRQNEPSIAVSTRNTSHLLAGANDYRSVDFEELFGEQISGEPTPDAWLGVFKSFDGGATWASTLLPGFPADATKGAAPGQSVSPIFGLAAAADPIVRAGTNGMFYYAGIAFNRNSNVGKLFVARFIDNNNKENGDPTNLQTPGVFTAVSPTDPIRYLGNTVVQSGSATQFLDKPWLAVDVPRGSATCTISYSNPGGTTTSTQTIPASNLYMTFSDFVNNDTQSAILFTHSTNCGATWSSPIALSGVGVNQGSVIAVAPPIPGTENLLPPIVYVAWRQFGSGNTPSAIMMAESLNGGTSFTPAFAAHSFPLSCNTTPTGSGCPFDQGITGASFRTNAYPTMAADTTGRMYLAWSQRQANGDARIMMQVGLVGIPIPSPTVVDNGSVLDDTGKPFTNLSGRGHQIMPSLTFNAGKLTMIYYDLRQDHTIGQFTPLANLNGYGETRLFEGELSSTDNADASVFNFWISDADPPLSLRRHTLDVQGAQATPLSPLNLSVPGFSAFRIAHYQFGINPYDNSTTAQQLGVNPPNLPMFQTGTVPFIGDYIDVAGAPTFVMSKGAWHFNTDATAGLPVFHAAWTDNRNVQPPPNGNWAEYTPPYSASNPSGSHNSVFDPTKTVLTCNPGFVAMRNQDIYTSRIAPGLVVLTPGNQKTLGTVPNSTTLLQRAFAVVVQNTTAALQSFRLTIANQPLLANGSTDPKGQATFQQIPATPTVTTLDVQVNPLSSISRSVFVKSQNATASVTVNVQQITAPGGTVVSGGLTSTTVINPDPTAPPIINPDNPAVGNPAIGNAEVYNPAVGNPAIGNPAVGNTEILNPAISNPAISNPAVGNPAVGNPAVSNQAVSAALNPAVSNPAISNPAVGNPAISNPAVGNQSVTDATYTLTNTGNTTATYAVKLFGNSSIPSSLLLQLIVNKAYFLNEPGGMTGCTLETQPTYVILSNIPNPPIVTDPTTLGNPAISNPAVGNATVAVPPGETVQVTLRISPGQGLPPLTPAQVQSMVLNNITPVVVSHAVNTQNLGQTNPQPPISLTITTKTLPNGNLNTAYSQSVSAIGGVINPPTTNYTWTLFSGNLPPGLSIATSGANTAPKVGLISGTPTAGGTYNFVVQVADAATPTAHIAQQALSITVIAPLAANTAPLSAATTSQSYAGQLTATGGTPPYTWSINPPNPLPGVGLALNPATGQITGIPTTTGTVTFTATVKDSSVPQQSSSQVLSIQVVSPLVFNLPATQTTTAGQPFSELLTQYTSGGLPPYTYSVTAGSVAPFSLASSIISGTPAASGTTGLFTIQASDQAGDHASSSQTININPAGSPHLTFTQQPAATGNGFQTMSPVKVQATDASNAPVPGLPVTIGFGTNGCSTPGAVTYPISSMTTGGQVTVTTAASVWPYLYASISGTGTSLDSPQLVRIASVQDSEHFTLATGGVAASTGSITVYYTSYPLANISNTGGGTFVSATVASFTANSAPALLTGQWVMISNASPSSFNTTAPVQVVNAGLLEGGYTINYNQSGTSGNATVPGMVTIVQLGGTLTQTTGAGGIATFPDLQLNTGGAGYTFTASAAGFSSAASNAFTQYGYCATAGNMNFPHWFNGASDASAILGTGVDGDTPMFTGGKDFSGNVTPNVERLCTADEVRRGVGRAGQFCAPTDFATLMTAARTNHIAVSLQSSSVLIAGGFGTGGSTALATAEIINSEVSYTPVSAQMVTARANAAAILLRDGRVLIAGGGNNGNGDNTAELFDATTNTFYPTANNMSQSRGQFAVPILLNSGRVLIVGGTSSSGQVDIFDPTTDSFVANPPSLNQPRNIMAAALLPNGKVLVAGGAGTIVSPGCGDPGPTGSLQSAELYDPVANSFSCAGSMALPVQEFSALTLANGTVLLPGGRNETAAPADLTTATSELYNPLTQQFSYTAPLRDGRYLYDLFPSGSNALVAGGTAQDGGTSLLSAELYNAPDQLVSGTATVTSISVFPASATVPVGRSYQFTGVATLSDGSTRFVPVPATWASSNTGLATAATNGVITPLAGSAGQSVNVTVNFGSVTSPAAVLHISGSALSFSPPGTQSASQGVPFSEDLSTYTSGGTPPYTYSIVSGSTAPFSLSGSVISGTANSPGSASFTVRVFDSAANSLTASQTINITNPVSINNIIPSPAAGGVGQMVTIFTTGIPDPSHATATLTQGGTTGGGFVFLGPSAPNVLYVRLPSGFPTGPSNIVVTNTTSGISSAPFPITISTTPGTPQVVAVYSEAAAPGSGPGGVCGSGPTGSPISSVVAGQGIVVYGYGIDTQGSNVVFSDGGSHPPISVIPSCSFSSASLGLGVAVTVPFGYLINGSITMSLQTQVNGVNSALSAPVSLTLTSWQLNISSIPDTPTTAGQGFPISAQLLDNNNNPVSGVAVAASVSSNFCPSGALVGTVTMQTDANGNLSYTDTNITLGGNDYVLTVAPPFAPSAGDQDNLVTNVGFCPTLNNMSDSRDLHTSVLVSSSSSLPGGPGPGPTDSGPILVAGGIDNAGNVSNTADLYNAATNKFTQSSHHMVSARAGHTATALGNNQVLLAGGYADSSTVLGTNTGTAEIYNATTDTFTATTGEMVHPRQGHSATLLSNGMVLIAGGIADTDGYNGSISIPAELYNPSTGTFTAITNPMVNVRTQHTATLLPDGTVLIAGGAVPAPAGGGGYTLDDTNTAEIFTLNTGNPANSTFTATANNMSSARYGQIAVFTPPINSGLLSPPFPNQVLLAGGTASNLNTDDQTSADLYDPTSKTFTPTGSMATARWGHVGVAQFNGSVMVAGGNSVNVTQLSSAELFKPTFGSNPPTGTFQPQPSMSVPRINATATGNFSNLSNPDNPFTGIILVTGGYGNGVTQNTGEVYYGGSGLATD